jgi:hypothetical protein
MAPQRKWKLETIRKVCIVLPVWFLELIDIEDFRIELKEYCNNWKLSYFKEKEN